MHQQHQLKPQPYIALLLYITLLYIIPTLINLKPLRITPIKDAVAASFSIDILPTNTNLLAANTNSNPFATEILPPEQAYRFNATVKAPDQLRLNWNIATGTYLYKESFKLELGATTNVTLGPITWPAAIIKRNTIRPSGEIGDIELYRNTLELIVPLQRINKAATQIKLIVKYQGCAERGFCYPPITKRILLNLPAVSEGTPLTLPQNVAAPESTAPNTFSKIAPKQPLSAQDHLATKLTTGNLFGIIITFLGLGLLLAFTPCVFPMIPILSGIIVGQGPDITPIKAFRLSLIYVLAMALTYTLAGILAGLFGQNLQAAFQTPWIIGSFVLVFIALALAMFDLYEIQLPTALQTKLTILSNKQQSGSLIGTAIMGALSALIVSPCIAPPLAGALIYIGQTGDAFIGGVALFALGIGMGIPLLIIGTSAGQFLPRAGIWMNVVKAVFGVLLLGVAIILLERIMPAFITMLLWGTLLVCTGVYMGAFNINAHSASIYDSWGWAKLWQGLGLVLFIYGAMILVGAGVGSNDPLRPLQPIKYTESTNINNSHISFQPINTYTEFTQALTNAKQQKRPVLVDFYADWCVSCKELEQKTFAAPKVAQILNNFVLLRIDVTANNAQNIELMQKLNIVGPPTILFYDRNGMEQRHLRIVGFMPVQQFLNHIAKLQSNIKAI